jgi:hypothetical protein
MGMTIDEDQHDGKPHEGASMLAGYRIWRGEMGSLHVITAGGGGGVSGPAPLGVECALSSNGYQEAMRHHPMSADEKEKLARDMQQRVPTEEERMAMALGLRNRDPYIPAGCDQQGRIESGRRASEVASDWANLDSASTHRRVELQAWLAAISALALVGWGVYVAGKAMGWWS